MKQRYCYWSVCDGPYTDLMERCVASARAAGVFKDFHVFTDRPIPGCDCYDGMGFDKTGGLFKLVYLKAAVPQLLYDYFVWVDADTRFVRNPTNVLDCMAHSPIHVPLVANLALCSPNTIINGISPEKYVELMTCAGIHNEVYFAGSAFWIVRREAIETVVALALEFKAYAQHRGIAADVSFCLSYAMQMLCANPKAHLMTRYADLWASDDHNRLKENAPGNSPWILENPVTGERRCVSPCIIHLPHSRTARIDLSNLNRESTVAYA